MFLGFIFSPETTLKKVLNINDIRDFSRILFEQNFCPKNQHFEVHWVYQYIWCYRISENHQFMLAVIDILCFIESECVIKTSKMGISKNLLLMRQYHMIERMTCAASTILKKKGAEVSRFEKFKVLV